MTDPNKTVLERWHTQRDAEAFQTIVLRYSRMVYATCRRILGSDTEAEDVTQECFEALAVAERPPGAYVGPWLHRVATNLALKRIRSERRRKQRESRFAAESEADMAVEWDDIYRYVDEAIAELPERLRVPDIAHFLNNQTHAAVAQTLGVPRRTVTYRIAKGIELIRKSLKKRGITVAASALTAMLGANLAEAAPIPASLGATLGKLALSGATSPAATSAASAATSASIIGGVFMVKKAIVGLAAVLAAAGGLWVVQQRSSMVHRNAGEITGEADVQPDERLPFQQGASLTDVRGDRGLLVPGATPQTRPHKAEASIGSVILPPDLGKPGSVSGTVRFAQTGRPAGHARVLALEHPEGSRLETVADDRGEYAIVGLLPLVEYSITARSHPDGYVASECPKVTLGLGESVTDMDIFLSQGASIYGTVRFQDTNQPLLGAKLLAKARGWRGPTHRQTTSDEAGAYVLDLLPAENYCIMCYPPKGTACFTFQEPGYQSRKVSVGRDEQVENADFSFVPGMMISGHVAGPAGAVEGAEVLAGHMSLDPSPWLTFLPSKTTTGSDGRYLLTGIAGGHKYTIQVAAQGYTSATRQIDVPEEGLVELDFVLEDEAIVLGRVISMEGRPLSNVLVTLGFGGPHRGKTDGNGGFAIRSVPAGTYRFHVDFTGKGVLFQPSLNPAITVRAGQELRDVEVRVVAPQGDGIEGYVRDERGEPIPGVAVSAVKSHDGLLAEAITDDAGHYRLELRGDFVVGLVLTHEGYAGVGLRDVPVGTEDADVVLGPPARIAGIVIDGVTTVPLDIFEVRITALHPYDSPFPTGSHGRPRRRSQPGEFEIEGVSPGIATVLASAPGYAPQEIADIVVAGGQVTSGVTFCLAPFGSLEGYITQNGEPLVSGATVEAALVGTERTIFKIGVNEDSYYCTDGLLEGTYTVRATVEGEDPVQKSVEAVIAPGQMTRVDFEMAEP